MAGKEKVEAEMGSNLRGDYYFPTARKRYLPRIRKADEALDEVPSTCTFTAMQFPSFLKFIFSISSFPLRDAIGALTALCVLLLHWISACSTQPCSRSRQVIANLNGPTPDFGKVCGRPVWADPSNFTSKQG